jgi:hypothetical protein
MKTFSKITTVLGGALLAAGCGTTDVVGAQANVTAAADAPIKLSALNTGIDLAKQDRLVGYYSGCEGFAELGEWSIAFGDGAKGKASPLKLTKGDTGCTLTVTGFYHAERTFSSTNTAGTPVANAKQYKLFRADDPDQLAALLVATNSTSNPWNPANAAVGRLVDSMGAVDTTAPESTMVNVGAYNVDGSDSIITGPLNFKNNFRIETITGTPGSITNSSATASFIGYASMVGSATSTVKAPAYVSGTIDATIYTNSNDVIITSDKFFRFNKGADVDTGGTEYTYALPGYKLLHADASTVVTDASYAALNDGEKYNMLRIAFDNLSGNQGLFPLNPSASALTIAASTLFPIGQTLAVALAQDLTDPMNPIFTNDDLSGRRNVVMISRRDPRSGVRSYQAIYLRLNLLN